MRPVCPVRGRCLRVSVASRPLGTNSSEPSHPCRRRRAGPQGPACHCSPPCLHRKRPHAPQRATIASENTHSRDCKGSDTLSRHAVARHRRTRRTVVAVSAGHAIEPGLAIVTVSAVLQNTRLGLTSSALRIRRHCGIETHAWPSTPFAPASPIRPGLPASPAVPFLPGVPGLPSTPFVPFLPSAAGAPGAPAEPGAPRGPAGPCSPSAPAGPSWPSKPVIAARLRRG